MEVFISYSTKDSTIANAVCAALENSGIGCFIAPRDIHPGLSYASEIIRGINEVKAFLVIISSNSNESEHVANEVEIAFNAKKTIIPFFVENVPMSLELKYYLSRKHWLIAYPHYELQLPNLVKVLSELLGVGDVPAQSDEDNNVKTENGIANAENGKPDGVDDCPPVLRGTSAAEGVNDSPSTDDGGTVVGNPANPVILNASEPSVDARRGQSQGSYKHANREILPPSGRQNDKGGKWKDESEKMKDDCDGVEDCPPALRGTSVAEGVNDSPFTDDGETVVGNSSGSCHPERSEGTYKYANEEILPPSGRQNDNSGELRDESGKMKDDCDGVEDCPPALRGTSVAEGVNDSPSTDDGETVVGNSSGSCHPERSEGTYKYANEEILPPSGRQNDNSGELRDESGEVKDESDGVEDCPPALRGTSVAERVNDSPVTDDGETVDGDQKDNGGNGSQGLIGSSKKRWAIIIAVLLIGAAAALLGTMSGSERGYDDNAAERELVATDVVPASATDVIPAAAVEIQIPQKNDNSLSTRTFTVNGVSFKMVAVDGGTFTMGATSEQQNPYDDEKPVHNVTLSDYFIGETEVTQALWEAVMGSNPSYFSGSNNPVEQVSYDDCITFINKLNSQLSGQLPSGRKFRLPTEAEWEFAARGGNRSRGNQYSGSNSLGSVAWCGDNSNSQTHPVKQKQANELGLYDMSGNVWEWCYDWYGNYSSSSQTNSQGPSSGSCRVLRGGCWDYYAQICRVAYRNSNSPGSRIISLGLRLAL